MRYTDSYDDDDEDFDEVEEDMMADALALSNRNREDQVELAKKQMNQELLDKAIFISKNCWFWGLFPQCVKLYNIAQAYQTFKKLIGE
jgi:hypothetical protein